MGLLEGRLGHMPDSDDLADVRTMFGRTQVYDVEDDEGNVLRVLDVAGTWQSASYVDERWADLAFEYHRVFDRALGIPTPVRRALMLGGGALSYPKHMVVACPQAQLDVVEVDPQVVALAERWFLVDRLDQVQRSRLNVVCDDAVAFLRAAAQNGERYDLVVNDLFAAERPTRELMSPEGLGLVREVLHPEGIYVANVVSALKGMKARPLRKVKEALGLVFSQVEVVSLGADQPRVPDNNVVFATNGAYSLAEALLPSSSGAS